MIMMNRDITNAIREMQDDIQDLKTDMRKVLDNPTGSSDYTAVINGEEFPMECHPDTLVYLVDDRSVAVSAGDLMEIWFKICGMFPDELTNHTKRGGNLQAVLNEIERLQDFEQRVLDWRDSL
jgi:hypothetical protein